MDDTPLGYHTPLASSCVNLERRVASGTYSETYASGADSLCISSSHFFNGGKRKWNGYGDSVNQEGRTSLVLELGQPSSSCITSSSEKEMEEESPINLGLGINLHGGNDKIYCMNEVANGTVKALQEQRPKLDLELSLSTGPAESDITSVTQGSTVHHKNNEGLAVAIIQIMDEGSTSSRWKHGPLVPPFRSGESNAPFDKVYSNMNLAPFTKNLSPAAPALPKNLIASASSDADQQSQRRTSSMKTCHSEGCTKGARGASGLCIAHGGGRRCQRAGCQKGAEGRTVFCKAHGGGRRCQHLGCTKSAEGRTDYCIGHGGGRRCCYEGCTRAARGKSGLCIRHGGGKRCKIENCTKSAEGISGLCISHGGGRRCQHPSCPKGAQGSTMFCKAHGGGKRCTFLGCTKGAEGSTPFCKGHGGGKRCTSEGCTKSVHGGTLFCVSHGGGKRCAMASCTKSARGRTNFCVRHGGGKRCKFEGCTKSAQGSTDFCKAHGGGKRCSWEQLGAGFGSQAAVPCDKFARGKSGLCAAHSAEVQDKQISSCTVGSKLHDPQSSTLENIRAVIAARNNPSDGILGFGFSIYEHGSASAQAPLQDNIRVGSALFDQLALPEGRVHGGSLMAMLTGTTNGIGKSNQDAGG